MLIRQRTLEANQQGHRLGRVGGHPPRAGEALQPPLPPVQAVRLDLPTDALADPDDPAQYFIESEVSFDGQAWRDLYAEELPEELQGLRPTN